MNEVSLDFSNGIAPVSPPSGRGLRGGLSAPGFAPSPQPSPNGRGSKDALRECSVCDEPKPASGFRQVVGRVTTEACGDCCDRRDEFSTSADPMGHAAIAAFCLRVAIKRFEKFQSTQIDGCPPVDSARSLRSGAPLFSRDEKREQGCSRTAGRMPALHAAPTFSGKEKSALAKDPKEYAAWLQKLPDRVAAIVAKTYAVMGDDAHAHGIPEDVALVMILDLLNSGDDTLIARNANKKLARKS